MVVENVFRDSRDARQLTESQIQEWKTALEIEKWERSPLKMYRSALTHLLLGEATPRPYLLHASFRTRRPWIEYFELYIINSNLNSISN